MESVIATNVPTPTPDSDSSSFEKPTPTPDSDSSSFKKPTPTPDSDSSSFENRLPTPTPAENMRLHRLRLQTPTPQPCISPWYLYTMIVCTKHARYIRAFVSPSACCGWNESRVYWALIAKHLPRSWDVARTKYQCKWGQPLLRPCRPPRRSADPFLPQQKMYSDVKFSSRLLHKSAMAWKKIRKIALA